MQPTILDGDMITVEPIVPTDVKKRDIILYRSTMGVTAHRVIRIENRTTTAPLLILRGDAPGSPDEPVAVQQLLGKVVWVERGSRRLDPYSLKVKILRAPHILISILRRWVHPKGASSGLSFGERPTI